MSNQLDQVDYKARAFKSVQPAHLRFKQHKHIVKLKAGETDESQCLQAKAPQGLSVDVKANEGTSLSNIVDMLALLDYAHLPNQKIGAGRHVLDEQSEALAKMKKGRKDVVLDPHRAKELELNSK